MSHRREQKWMRDVERSQHSIVVPDTAENEARLWRNFISGKLSTLQVIGFVLMCGILAGPAWLMAKGMASIFGLLFLAGCGAAFLLLCWRVRRALRDKRLPKS